MTTIDHPRTMQLPRVVVGQSGVPLSIRRDRWAWLLAAGSFVLYTVVALYVVYIREYQIGDAVARTAAAHHVVLSRDPHLAAMGFYWMPLPTLSQIPVMLILAPFGWARFAGPVTSALWAAATIPVLAAIGRRNQAPRRLTIGLCVIYALSPVVVWAGSDGMSEASSFFFLALIVHAYSGWRRDQRPADLVLLALALAGEMLCRYEAIPLAIIMAAVVSVALPRPRWVRTMVFIGLPAAYVFLVWLVASHLIVGDAFYWFRELNALAKASGSGAAIFKTTGSHAVNVVSFTLTFVSLFALLLPALIPFCLRDTWRGTVRALGLLAPGFLFPVLLASQMLRHNAPAAARYFYPCWVVAVAAALALAGDPRWPRSTRAYRGVLLSGAAGLTAVIQLLAFANPRVANVEREDILFAPLTGRPVPEISGSGLLVDQFVQWEMLFAVADPMLEEGDLLLLDTDAAPFAPLFSDHPRQLVIPEDRDFEPILAAPEGRVDLVAVQAGSGGRPSRYAPAIIGMLSGRPDLWEKIGTYGGLDLYRYSGQG